ncbi:hypothetical protein Tco_1484422 [Tanacetum coccineum]
MITTSRHFRHPPLPRQLDTNIATITTSTPSTSQSSSSYHHHLVTAIHDSHHTNRRTSPAAPPPPLHATTAVQPPLRVRWYSSPEMGVFVYVAKPQGCVRVGFQSTKGASGYCTSRGACGSTTRVRLGFGSQPTRVRLDLGLAEKPPYGVFGLMATARRACLFLVFRLGRVWFSRNAARVRCPEWVRLFAAFYKLKRVFVVAVLVDE